MASINVETSVIMSSTRGEAVRDAITGACDKIAPEKPPIVAETDEGKYLVVDESGVWNLGEWVVVKSLAMTAVPTKTTYQQMDTLDLSGCVVSAVFDDNSTRDVTSECVFFPADGEVLSDIGAQTVNVSYTDSENGITVTTSFDVTVEEVGG